VAQVLSPKRKVFRWGQATEFMEIMDQVGLIEVAKGHRQS
jgi:hypothetical protein